LKDGWFSKRRVIILSALLVIALLCLAFGTALERGGLTSIEKMFRDAFSPLQTGAMVIYGKIAAIPDYFVSVANWREENENLKKQVSSLQEDLNNLKEVEQENIRLEELLGAYDSVVNEWDPVVAKVISRSNSIWYNTLTIKGGEDQGFLKNMVVVNADGLIGRIMNVSKHTSEVLLILDKEAAVAAFEQITRTPGIIEGSDKKEDMLSFIHVPYDAVIKENQIIISSGLGGIYPAGLRIGYITDITVESGGLMLSCAVQPFVDFDRLEEVMVLKPLGAGVNH